MTVAAIPKAFEMTMEAACEISLECWRLSRTAVLAKEGNDSGIFRYSIGRITDALKGVGLETIDLTGRKYDAGLAPEVLNVVLDDTLPAGELIIDETISPIVTWRGQIINPGQIIVKRSSLEDKQ